MTICKTILGKEIDELVLADIVKYFQSPKEESDVIEYKSFHEKNQNNFKIKENAILKTICGFLNSNGGLLIWGAPEEKKRIDSKVYEGDLSPVQKELYRDDFINKIVHRIQPIANSVKFLKIRISSTEFVYIIEVPESSYKPHQFDSRFWMRNDGQTNVAPYHYVEAMFKKISFPNLSGEIQITDRQILPHNDKYRLTYVVILKNLSFYQNETNPKLTVIVDGHNNKVISDKTVLHNGDPIKMNGNMSFNSLDNHNFEVMIKFGGDKSPMKVTKKIIKCKLFSDLEIDSSNNILKINIQEELIFQDRNIFEIE